jgi:hypothetical protein
MSPSPMLRVQLQQAMSLFKIGQGCGLPSGEPGPHVYGRDSSRGPTINPVLWEDHCGLWGRGRPAGGGQQGTCWQALRTKTLLGDEQEGIETTLLQDLDLGGNRDQGHKTPQHLTSWLCCQPLRLSWQWWRGLEGSWGLCSGGWIWCGALGERPPAHRLQAASLRIHLSRSLGLSAACIASWKTHLVIRRVMIVFSGQHVGP